MSTNIIVVNPKPGHRAVRVHTEDKVGAQWEPRKLSTTPPEPSVVRVGENQTFLVHGSAWLIIEEVEYD